MNNRKNYNSIVFLTTLGVYLGLVLAGGSAPSVLAQAATTRDFNIKNEIVVEDDLDKKPDDEEIKHLADSFSNYYLEPLNDLIQNLKDLRNRQSFDLDSNLFDAQRTFAQQCFFDSEIIIAVENSGNIRNEFLRSPIEKAKDKFEYLSNFSDCFQRDGFDKNGAKASKSKFTLNQSELAVEVSIEKASAQNAKTFLEKLNLARNAYFNKTDVFSIAKTNPLKVIYENTKAFSENNQVFIVTRLPRASIDALLAEK